MEEPLEQEHSITNDDLKPSSSSTTTKSSRSTNQTTNGTTRCHKRRHQTNSIRSSSGHSLSSNRSSSSSSNRSAHSSIKNFNSNEQEVEKSRSYLAQEQIKIIVNKTKTGKYDILDSFAFLSFETEDDWRTAFEHFDQRQIQKAYTTKKSHSLSGKKNGSSTEHLDGQSFHRSVSVPCKIEDAHRISAIPTTIPMDDTSIENHRSSMWHNISPNKNSNDYSSTSTVQSKPIDEANHPSRVISEHDEHHFDIKQHRNSTTSSQKSNDDMKIESNDKKRHHHHHHHHHKSHKRHKTKHDLSANGDSDKHPTITSMSDLAKQHVKNEQIPLPSTLHFPSHCDPRFFPLPSFAPFPPPPHLLPSFLGPYDHSLMLSNRHYGSQYLRDVSMPPPPRPPSRSLQHSFPSKENQPDPSASMENMLEKYYPGVLPSYLAAAASAAAAATTTHNNSSVSSLNVKMHGTSATSTDHHSLWSHREALQRQLLAASNKPNSTKSPIFDPNTKLSSNYSGSSSSSSDNHRHHNSSNSSTDISNSTSASNHPLYLAPVIVTEFHQHQHNHNHTHEHKLNITTKDDRQSSPTSKTPLSHDNKKTKSSFSVTDMFIDKTSPSIKHSPQQQGFLSVVNNKKDNNQSSLIQLKKPSNGKWSTAHVQIAWMIFNHEQRQRHKLNLNSASKVRPTTTLIPSSASSSSQPNFLPPPLPVVDNHDLSLLRPPLPPPFSFPFDINSQHNPLFRPILTTKLPLPTVTPSSTSIKTPTIKREQRIPFSDERIRRTSPPSLTLPTPGSNFFPSSLSQRTKMDFPPLVLPPQQQQHQLPSFSLHDDRKRFVTPNADLLPPFGPPSVQSPFLSPPFSMGTPPIPPPSIHSSSSRRSGINSDSSKSTLFPPPLSVPFDVTRPSLLPSGLPLPNNHLEADRYRVMLEQKARERDMQYAMIAAATGNVPPLLTDPSSSRLFKHY